MKNVVHTILAVALGVFVMSCGSQKLDPLQQGINSFEAADDDNAKMHFETLLADDPENADALYYLGRIAMRSKDFSAAVDHFEKAVVLDDTKSNYHLQLGAAYAQQIQTLGFMEQGRLAPKIKTEFEKAVERGPSNVDARNALAQFYLRAPAIVGGSKEKAMEQLAAIKEIDPREGHLLSARVYMTDKNYDAAEKEYKAMLSADANDVDAHFQMGFLHQAKEDYARASTAFEKVLKLDDKHHGAAYQIGRTALFSGENLERGAEALTSYLKTQPGPGLPSWAHAHWRLGDIYAKMGDTDRARTEYETALKLDPELKEAKEALDNL